MYCKNYYVLKDECKGHYDLPDRFDVYELARYCDEYEYDMELFTLNCCESDDRSDDEVARDDVKPIKDRIIEVNNFMARHEDDNDEHGDEIADILGLNTATLEEMYNINDMGEMWFKAHEDGDRIMMNRLAWFEDIVLEWRYQMVSDYIADKY